MLLQAAVKVMQLLALLLLLFNLRDWIESETAMVSLKRLCKTCAVESFQVDPSLAWLRTNCEGRLIHGTRLRCRDVITEGLAVHPMLALHLPILHALYNCIESVVAEFSKLTQQLHCSGS